MRRACLLQNVVEFSLLWMLNPALTIANNLLNNGPYLSDHVMQTVLADYHKEIRPYNGNNSSSSSPVVVLLDMSLRQIIDLDEPKQTLTTNVWLRMYWTDRRLTWNSSNFQKIEKIILPSTFVWIPDLTLYDNALTTSNTMNKYRVSIKRDGSMGFQYPDLLSSLCTLDTTFFPFDTQHCNLSFGSWAYDGFEIDIFNYTDRGQLSNYKEHVEWSVIKLTALRVSPLYSGVPYPMVIFGLHIKRKPLFYIINLLFPTFLMSGIAVVGFLLPAESGEKVSLQIMVLLSLSVFQLILLDLMPASSETYPIISIYFTTSIVLVSLSLLMTVIGLNIYFRGHQGHILSSIMKTLCVSCIGRILCIHPEQRRKSTLKSKVQSKLLALKRRPSLFTITDYDACAQGSNLTGDNMKNADENQNSGMTFFMESVLRYCRRISIAVECLSFTLNAKVDEEGVKDEWKLIATSIDRLFLLIFCLVSVIVYVIFATEFLKQ